MTYMALTEKTAQNLPIASLQGDKTVYADKGDSLLRKNILEF
jgi:hypothetical protein